MVVIFNLAGRLIVLGNVNQLPFFFFPGMYIRHFSHYKFLEGFLVLVCLQFVVVVKLANIY